MPLDASAVLVEIRAALTPDLSEETLRVRFEHILANKLAEFGVSYRSVHERRTAVSGGRTDALFGHVIIEYKRPGVLSSQRSVDKSVQQLIQYLQEESVTTGSQLTRYAGILTDGYSIAFVRYSREEWQTIGPEPLNDNNITVALEYLRGLSRKPLDPLNLAADFGPLSPVARECMQAFVHALSNPTGKTQMLFEEWKHLFGQVASYDRRQIPQIQELETAFGLSDTDVATFFYALHTYYALITKILIAEILGLIRHGIEYSIAEGLAALGTEDLLLSLSELEDGGTLRKLQIENLLEGDFFSWYLDRWDGRVSASITSIVRKLLEYEPATTMVAPERVRDLLKDLYQRLVPPAVRHDLGEYYTPDWLAEFVLDGTGYSGEQDIRLLDPTCGTGTFLILAIKRAREYGQRNGIEPATLLASITGSIVGFDLNPLAVLAARTNYILALGDLLEHQSEPISIPIFLSDCIFSPSPAEIAGVNVVQYTVATQRGPILVAIPAAIITNGEIGAMLAEVETVVVTPALGRDDCVARVAVRLHWDDAEVDRYGSYVAELFEQIRHLELMNWNRIWTRIIKNHFASAAQQPFDIIAGNPPWLRWTRLPASYRATIQQYCREYGLFSDDAYVGGIETDISTVVTYSAVEKWLRVGGILGFLITQTVFKSESSAGFRRFSLPDGVPLAVQSVHDMVDIKPFDNVQNRTAVLFLKKGQRTIYPARYVKWSKIKPGKLRGDLTLVEARLRTEATTWAAEPIYGVGDPWLTAPADLLPILKRLAGASAYRARKGVTSDLNGVYWIQILGQRPDGMLLFRNMHSVGRHSVQPYEGLIEPGLVYPLARGRDAGTYLVAEQGIYVIVPQKGMRGFAAEQMRNYPCAHSYLARYEEQLRRRGSFRKYHVGANGNELGPFYSLWNVGTYTFADFKVVWREVQNPSDFKASILCPRDDQWLGTVSVVPDHKLYFVPCRCLEEACYLCGFLNSSAVRAFVSGYAVGTQIAAHIMDYVRIPLFDTSNPDHIDLATKARLMWQQGSNPEMVKAEIELTVERIVNSFVTHE